MSGPSSIPALGLAEALVEVATAMLSAVPEITHADQAVGDGDHGLAIERGFSAVALSLRKTPHEDVGEVLDSAGTAMLTSMGGASGAIYGTFFRRAGKVLRGQAALTAAGLADCLEAGLIGVQERGGAKVGDKTLVDALGPAAVASRTGGPTLTGALDAAAKAARDGAESTRELQAKLGRARSLGDRAIGHVDPGALSFSLMLSLLADAVRTGAQTAPRRPSPLYGVKNVSEDDS